MYLLPVVIWVASAGIAQSVLTHVIESPSMTTFPFKVSRGVTIVPTITYFVLSAPSFTVICALASAASTRVAVINRRVTHNFCERKRHRHLIRALLWGDVTPELLKSELF